MWFYPFNDVILKQENADDPLAAIITQVHNDRLVNLIVFSHDGRTTPRPSITLHQDGEGGQGYSFAEWMPYQVGQAKKHDALEAAKIDADKASVSNAAAGAWSAASEKAYLRRWAVEMALQAARNHNSDARTDPLAYAEKLRSFVEGDQVRSNAA